MTIVIVPTWTEDGGLSNGQKSSLETLVESLPFDARRSIRASSRQNYLESATVIAKKIGGIVIPDESLARRHHLRTLFTSSELQQYSGVVLVTHYSVAQQFIASLPQGIRVPYDVPYRIEVSDTKLMNSCENQRLHQYRTYRF